MCTCVNLNNGLCTFMLLLIVSKYGTGREVIFRAFGKPLRNPVPLPCLCGRSGCLTVSRAVQCVVLNLLMFRDEDSGKVYLLWDNIVWRICGYFRHIVH